MGLVVRFICFYNFFKFIFFIIILYICVSFFDCICMMSLLYEIRILKRRFIIIRWIILSNFLVIVKKGFINFGFLFLKVLLGGYGLSKFRK